MNKRIKAFGALTVLGALTLTGCGSSSGSSADTVRVVGYSVLQTANDGVIKAFDQTSAGKGITVQGTYGASGDESRAVDKGLGADEVHFSLEPDVTRLVDDGLVDKDWKDNATKGICTQSVVVMVVKKGNPLGIKSWSDLIKPGVQIVTPDPSSSGSAKWNLLAAYGSVLAGGGSAADATAYMEKFFGNVAALPPSGRDATTAFTSGTGNVLLSYENEAILARKADPSLDYVVPDTTLLIQNPCALTKDAPKAAADFMAFQKSTDGQKAYAETGYRPLPGVNVGSLDVQGAEDPTNPYPTPTTLQTIDSTFGGWDSANDKYFGDGVDGDPLGILTKLQTDYFKS